jgi:hypothetical protein
LIRRFGPRAVLIAGALTMAVGFVTRSLFHGSVVEVMVTSGIASLGTALAFAAMPTLIMRAVPITETASANGLNTLLRSIGTSSASALVAAVFAASMTRTETGALAPTFAAYQVVFWSGTAAALGGALIAAFIRRPVRVVEGMPVPGPQVANAPAGERSQMKADGELPEVLVRGRVVSPTGRPLRQAVATVLHPDGRHVDWGRTDNDGRYALALPEAGRYLLVVSAEGWAPQSGLVHLEAGETGEVTMTRRLLLSGHVTDAGRPLGEVMLSLIKHSGEYAGTSTADPTGYYELGLPPPGRYVLTAVDHTTGRTRSRALTVHTTSTTLDVDLVTGVPRPAERPEPVAVPEP